MARAPMIDEPLIERVALDLGLGGVRDGAPAKRAPAGETLRIDLGEIDRYLAGLAKPS